MSQTIVHLRATQVPSRQQSYLARLWQYITIAHAASVTRGLLADLDDRALSDIGISRAQAQFDAERPVWELVPFLHR
jgi:uncharacterized protein YjiS (DUF1127 family)